MLEVSNLSVNYGRHRALEKASLRVNKGEIVVILGANGAGKSTLLKAVSGVCEGHVDGSVVMQGAELAGLPPNQIVEHGIALVPEGRGIFADLTVHENLILGAYPNRARDEEAVNLDRVYGLFPKLLERRRQVVRTMSGGEQQMVAIGRALMSNPLLLTLDEPSLGLSPILCKDMFQCLRSVRNAGIGVLLVEQNAKQSLAIADRGYLLENAQIVYEDNADLLISDPAVQKAYLGGDGSIPKAAHSRPAAEVTAVRSPKMAPTQITTVRPTTGSSPSEIAEAALRGLSSTVQRSVAPTPEPLRARSATSEPRPSVTPMYTPNSVPTQTPPKPTKSNADALLGFSVSELVARASAKSQEQVTPRRIRSTPIRRNGVETPNTLRPTFTMPEPGDSHDRLQSILNEIEEAAARAQAYRPSSDTTRKR